MKNNIEEKIEKGSNGSGKKQNNVKWLGITSLLTDMSSEMIYPVLPFFLKTVLGAPMIVIGFIEGLAEAVASLMKYFSGWFSDKFKKYKSMTLAGYSISAFAKVFLFLSTLWGHVLAIRIFERLGKGIRTSPRDVLITKSVPREARGSAFGFHRTLDTVGAFLGTLIVILILWLVGGETEGIVRLIFILAAVPALLSIVVLAIFVKEPKKEQEDQKQDKPKVRFFDFKSFTPKFKKLLLVLTFFGLVNFSYAFYLLKAQEFLVLFLIPIAYLIYNAFYAASAFPAGKISDKLGRVPLLFFAFLLFAIVNIGFAFALSSYLIFILFAFYGVFIGIIDGVMKAFVSDLSEKEASGRAFGSYHLITGLTVFPANFFGGFLWDTISSSAPFVLAAFVSLLAGVILLFFFGRRDKERF